MDASSPRGLAREPCSFSLPLAFSGYGCDVYIEATGHPTSVVQGLAMIAKKGTFVEYSVFGEKVTCDWTTISDAKVLHCGLEGQRAPCIWRSSKARCGGRQWQCPIVSGFVASLSAGYSSRGQVFASEHGTVR